MNVSRKRQKIFGFQHFDGLFADCGGGFFEVEFACNGNDEYVMPERFAFGDKGFEHLSFVKSEKRRDFRARGRFFRRHRLAIFEIIVAFVMHAASVECTHCIGLFD